MAKRLHGLNGSGRAPAGLTAEVVRQRGHDAMPEAGLCRCPEHHRRSSTSPRAHRRPPQQSLRHRASPADHRSGQRAPAWPSPARRYGLSLHSRADGMMVSLIESTYASFAPVWWCREMRMWTSSAVVRSSGDCPPAYTWAAATGGPMDAHWGIRQNVSSPPPDSQRAGTPDPQPHDHVQQIVHPQRHPRPGHQQRARREKPPPARPQQRPKQGGHAQAGGVP